MDSVIEDIEDIEVIELVAPVDAPERSSDAAPPVAAHLQWAAQVFHAARVQPARAPVAPGALAPVRASNGAAGARTFYWCMLALAMLAFTLN
jgi:hypothetical protein